MWSEAGVQLIERGKVTAGRGGCTHGRVHRQAIACALIKAPVGNAPSAHFRSDPALLQPGAVCERNRPFAVAGEFVFEDLLLEGAVFDLSADEGF